MVTIEILDGDFDRYSFTRSNTILGRMYDNESEYVKVIKPESEQSSVCTMIITNGDTVVDHLLVNEEPIPIRNNISQYESVAIGFSFSREDGYVKNSEIKLFSFLRAQKPDDFVPLEPQQKINIDHLIGHSIINVKLNDKELDFYDVNGEITHSVDLSPFLNTQSDFAEDDDSKDTYIKNKSTKYLKNEGVDGKSPYATEDYVDKHGGKVDSIKVNDKPLNIEEDKSVNIEIPTKTSDIQNNGDGGSPFATEQYVNENGGKIDKIIINGKEQEIKDKKVSFTIPQSLSEMNEDTEHRTVTDTQIDDWNKKITSADLPDVSGFITKAVSDLTNYYTKNSIDTKVADLQSQISAIPKFAISVETALPTGDDISETTIYLLKTSTTETGNLYTEYIYVDGSWESLGTQTLDLTGYATETYVNNAIANFLTQSQVSTLITNSLLEYVKSSQLATIAMSGLLRDVIEDETHRVVSDAEKESWNSRVTKEEMAKALDESIGDLAGKLEGV